MVVHRLDRRDVKVLRVDNGSYQPFVEQVDRGLRDAADDPADLEALFDKQRLEELIGCKRWAARACLEGKTILKIRCRSHHFGAVLGHHQVARVLGNARCLAGDFLRIADLIDDDDVIHIHRLDGGREIGEGDERIRDHDDFISVFRVNHRVG